MEEEGTREGKVKVMEEWKRCKGRGEGKGKMVASILHGETFNHAEDFQTQLSQDGSVMHPSPQHRLLPLLPPP